MAFKMSRSGFYSWRGRKPSARAREDSIVLVPTIRSIFKDCRQTYGSVRIADALRDLGYCHSRRRVSRIMRQERLVPRQIRRFHGISKPGADTSGIPDLVERQFSSTAPNKVWVGDLTEIETLEGLLYLAFILDLCSRYVVGWATSDNKSAQVVITALTMAVTRRRPPRGFIFHSDHGGQYGDRLFQAILKLQGGVASMGSVGDCFDNAVSESFVHTLKGECLNGETLISRDFTDRLLFDYIEVFYNRKRKHTTIGNMSPFQFEASLKT